MTTLMRSKDRGILEKKAGNGLFYAEESLLGMDLERDCDQIISRLGHGQGQGEGPVQEIDIDTDMESSLMVRLLETYYVTQGNVILEDIQSLGNFIGPFLQSCNVVHSRDARKLDGNTVNEYRTIIHGLFEQHLSGVFICRGFAYAFWRMETGEDDDTLLDAFCILQYIIQLLQGKIPEFLNVELGDVVESEWNQYKHDQVDMTADDLLWCCCVLRLGVGSKLRKVLGPHSMDSLLSNNLVNQEIMLAKLGMEIRPEAPISFLMAYQMAIENKTIIPLQLRKSWMETAFSFMAQGLEEAQQWGDPYFLYVFHTLYAFWMPTDTYPKAYSHSQLQERLQTARGYKAECTLEGPLPHVELIEHHEDCLTYLLALHIFDKEASTMPPLVEAFRYPIPPVVNGCSPTSTITSVPRVDRDTSNCVNCSKPLSRTKQVGCPKCGMMYYCNRKCQLVAWKKGHKKDCKMMKTTIW